MKRIIVMLLVLSLSAVMVAGCGSEEVTGKASTTGNTETTGGNESVGSESTKDVELLFSIWDKNQLPGMQAIVDAFHEENPTITVKVEVTPWDEYWTKLEASTVGGAMPDVFWMHINEFFKYATNNKLMPVDDASIDRSKFPSGLVDLFTFNDVLYGVPKDFDTIGLIYNKDIFDAAGMAYPDESWTWDTFLKAAEQLTNPETGVYGFAGEYSTQEGFYNFIYQNGGSVINTVDHSSGYSMPETQEAVDFYFDLANKYGVSEDITYYSENGSGNVFASGKVAMMYKGSWNMSYFTSTEDIADKFDIAVLPMGKERASIYNGLTFSGAASTEHPAEVQKFLAFSASKRANELQAEHKSAIPAYEGTQQAWIDQFPDYNVQAFVDKLDYAITFPTSPSKPKWEEVEKTVLKSYAIGEITTEETFEHLSSEMNRILGQE